MTNSIHTNEMLALRSWLKRKREERALNMRELGKLLGKPHSYIQRVEDGERRLDVVEFVWYCRALDVDPHIGLSLVESQ